jgi:oligopeptide/dipeptide ABC transporter ATP-binding protein
MESESEFVSTKLFLMTTVLEVHDLRVDYRNADAKIKPALEGVSLTLRAGEILGVLGESGCGKSTLASAVLRLLASTGKIRSGSIRFAGQEILSDSERELEKIRGAQISIVFQEASLALHPTMRISEQVARVIGAHNSLDRCARLNRARQVLAEVFTDDVDRIFSSYPHQLSGGQRQRVLIAQAIACNPKILIADEPTASLDTTTQSEILALFAKLRKRHNMAIILITHNPAILSRFADKILVLYAGREVEEGPAEILLRAPQHPYLRDLLRSMPDSPEAALLQHKTKLSTIAGVAPDLSLKNSGCPFAPRCADKMEECIQREPISVTVQESHTAACFKYGG